MDLTPLDPFTKTQIYLHSQGDLLSIFFGHITIFLYHR